VREAGGHITLDRRIAVAQFGVGAKRVTQDEVAVQVGGIDRADVEMMGELISRMLEDSRPGISRFPRWM
jgi:hypothetical protein